MEFSPFKLLVTVIIALALLYIFFAYFAPYYFWAKDPQRQIAEALFAARANPGKAIEAKETIYDDGKSFSNDSFREPQMEIKFECNSASNCCDNGTKCGNAVEWNELSVSFKQKKFIETFARCDVEHNIAACTIYFGQKPAQIEITTINALKEMDLSKENLFKIDLIAKNSGNVLAPSVFAKARLLKQNSAKTSTELVEEKTTQETEIMPGKEKLITIDFEITQNANYIAEIRVQGENAGFEEKTIEFTATNALALLCSATEKGETIFDSATGKCETPYYCRNCTLAFECRQAWQKIEQEKQFIDADSKHAIAITEATNGACQTQ